MSLGDGAGPGGEPPRQWEEQTAEVEEQIAEVEEQIAEVASTWPERLDGLLYVPIADQAELATLDTIEGRGENDDQRTATDEQLKTAEVVARLEGLLRVRSPTLTSKRLAKLAHVNLNDEYGGETAVLMRGFVVALIYGGLFFSLFAAP